MNFLLICLILLCGPVAWADCEIEVLKKEITSHYKLPLPVKNKKGEIGTATVLKFKVSDYLMKVRNENFLIANMDLEIKWLKGDKQSVKTLVVANVDPETCTIESYESGRNVGTPLSTKLTR